MQRYRDSLPKLTIPIGANVRVQFCETGTVAGHVEGNLILVDFGGGYQRLCPIDHIQTTRPIGHSFH